MVLTSFEFGSFEFRVRALASRFGGARTRNSKLPNSKPASPLAEEPPPALAAAVAAGRNRLPVQRLRQPGEALLHPTLRRVLHQRLAGHPRRDYRLRVVRDLPEDRLPDHFLGLLQA